MVLANFHVRLGGLLDTNTGYKYWMAKRSVGLLLCVTVSIRSVMRMPFL